MIIQKKKFILTTLLCSEYHIILVYLRKRRKIISPIAVAAIAIFIKFSELPKPKGIGPINPKNANFVFPSEPENAETVIKIMPAINKITPTKNKSFIIFNI